MNRFSDISLEQWRKKFYDNYHENFDILTFENFIYYDTVRNGIIDEYYGEKKPLDDFANKIKKKYHFLDNQFYKEERYNDVDLYIILPNDEYIINLLCRDMSDGGYFLSSFTKLPNKVEAVFEPYYQNEINISKYDCLYHYSPIDNLDEVGLIPSHKNIIFNYPNRNYLSTREDIDLVYNLNYYTHKDYYYLYKVYPPKDIKFFGDAIYPNSVFTQQEIEPQYIEKYKYGLVSGDYYHHYFNIIQQYKDK